MLTRYDVFNRNIRRYELKPTACLWYNGEIAGFRFVTWKADAKSFSREYIHYDISRELVDHVGFLGVPESYYGLDKTAHIPLIESNGVLTTQEELDKEIRVIELNDEFLIAYILKSYLFTGYSVYEGKRFISYNKRIVVLNKLLHYFNSGESYYEAECTIYYGEAEKETVLRTLEDYVIDLEDISSACYRNDGSVSFWVPVSKLGKMLTHFGSLFTTTSICSLGTHFVTQEDKSIKEKDMFLFAPKTHEMLHRTIEHNPNGRLSEECYHNLKEQLRGQQYVVL